MASKRDDDERDDAHPAAIDSADHSLTLQSAGWHIPRGATDPVPDKIGKYDVAAEIGRGGMGIVYRARDPRLERSVAIKVLREGLLAEPGVYERFQREAKLLAQVDHSNIATIHAIDDVDGAPFLVLEYVPGESLADRISRGALAIDETLDIGERIAAALEAAHARGVIHRDLKPGNVRVTPDGTVKVLDFGLAKGFGEKDASNVTRVDGDADQDSAAVKDDADLTDAGTLLGTAAYMSPEQIQGVELDTRTDVWSLGCVLYECLAGRKLWPQAARDDRFRAILADEPDLQDLPDATPAALRQLLRRCLEKRPPQRLRHISEARTELADLRQDLRGSARSMRRESRLPRALTSFLGRGAEARALRDALDEPGLVTVAGPGGCGKTRLALEVARQLELELEHGACLIDLASVATPDLVIQAVATALGVVEDAKRPIVSSLELYLFDREMVLLLDNCEHVLPVVAGLVEPLLSATTRLRVLATSREALHVVGERLHRLAPLEAPDPATSEPDELESAEAVQLFLERAREADPSFVIDAGGMRRVASICHHLDGLPLAVELAAARARALSLEQIEERLDDRFRLLRGGSRSALPRHKTLLATIEWSNDQLTPELQAVLRRISIFAGGFTLDGAEAVAGFGEVDELDVLDLLTALLDRSLVLLERRPHEVRYRLLESVREFGRQRSRDAREDEETRSRHLGHVERLVERAARESYGPDIALWFDRLQEELPDLRQALKRCASTTDLVPLGMRILVSLDRFWRHRGHAREALAMAEDLLAADRDAKPTVERATLLGFAGRIHRLYDDLAAARRMHLRELAIAEDLGDEKLLGHAYKSLGAVEQRSGDSDAMRSHCSAALEIARRHDDDRLLADALTNMSLVHWADGEHEACIRDQKEAAELNRKHGDLTELAMNLSNLGVFHLEIEDHDGAVAFCEQALTLRQELGDIWGVERSRINLASCLLQAGDVERAHELNTSSLNGFRRLGHKEGIGTALNNIGFCELLLGRPGAALARFQEALAMSQLIGEVRLSINVIENAARAELALGQWQRPAALLGACEAARESGGFGRYPQDQVEFDNDVARGHELGGDAFTATFERGRALDLDAAAHLAIEDADPTRPGAQA